MSLIKVHVTPVFQYGHTRYFPACENAAAICEIKGSKTLTKGDAEVLRRIGIPVVVKAPEYEPYVLAEGG